MQNCKIYTRVADPDPDPGTLLGSGQHTQVWNPSKIELFLPYILNKVIRWDDKKVKGEFYYITLGRILIQFFKDPVFCRRMNPDPGKANRIRNPGLQNPGVFKYSTAIKVFLRDGRFRRAGQRNLDVNLGTEFFLTKSQIVCYSNKKIVYRYNIF